MRRDKILIVEDDGALLQLLSTFLSGKGYEVLSAPDCVTAQRLWNAQRPDAAVVDHVLPDGDSLKLLSRWKDSDPQVPIVVVTGNGSIDVAVQAVKRGAEQFVTKPVELTALYLMLEDALETSRKRRRRSSASGASPEQATDPFLGRSTAIQALAAMSRKLVETDSSVLITGETGSGKGVLARWLHENSPRRAEQFVDLNCAGFSRDLLESELFGHEKGAFTGAVQSKAGLIELGHHGTVFLDEIGDMELGIQPRLLKVLEEKKFRRVGDVRDRMVDVRFLAGTHHDLINAVHEKKFRSDLYFRIATITLAIPPLRERAEDIPVIAERLLPTLRRTPAGDRIELTPEAAAALQAYAWPGNIRELRNILEKAVLLSDGKPIAPEHLHFISGYQVGTGNKAAPRRKTAMTEVEKEHIQAVLQQENGNVREAARKLGIPRSSLYIKLKEYGLTRHFSSHGSSPDFDDPPEDLNRPS